MCVYVRTPHKDFYTHFLVCDPLLELAAQKIDIQIFVRRFWCVCLWLFVCVCVCFVCPVKRFGSMLDVWVSVLPFFLRSLHQDAVFCAPIYSIFYVCVRLYVCECVCVCVCDMGCFGGVDIVVRKGCIRVGC